ncbi:tRNA preQ1(34) S-adenosylmethionine ribosyltransferase-isomerase QueA [candidate division KSB3 bacterium]|uniref:S-adenosylmethionine:tRNA ribosyltransferase-isomerase n=1 Tax=candidate division KSB3 bacterium TaxID=2044937 RepID=A0A2G6KL23_9BACT|nr:MAG: tRNA preQ1(34) S-adenosylmethionine ribosyltransferase-isomerase QueA [candidate division KSB3 bacterium]
MRVSEFDFTLPPELIAQHPAESRDQSRLMIVNRADKSLTHSTFAYLPEYLSGTDVLIVNNTKVIPARLQGHKQKSGGKVEVFLLRKVTERSWEVLLRGKVRPGTRIEFADDLLICTVREKSHDSGKGLVEFDPADSLKERLYSAGNVPLPPYIKRDDGVLAADHTRYQTVYAEHEGAVAAPTAGLHFSEPLLETIRKQGIDIIPVTLHVGIGTFQPVKVDTVEDHHIMPELYDISENSARRISAAIEQKKRIVTVGTTSTRLLEAVYAQHGNIPAGNGWADIFIYPSFQFQVTQALITNFHLPKSSLLMLISAFGGMDLIRKAYREAIEHRYRFYSYGDAMFIL